MGSDWHWHYQGRGSPFFLPFNQAFNLQSVASWRSRFDLQTRYCAVQYIHTCNSFPSTSNVYRTVLLLYYCTLPSAISVTGAKGRCQVRASGVAARFDECNPVHVLVRVCEAAADPCRAGKLVINRVFNRKLYVPI
ncbi:hypothetical protein J3E69DRAFT_347193 [Trichoderma sp. SZMC 28015]